VKQPHQVPASKHLHFVRFVIVSKRQDANIPHTTQPDKTAIQFHSPRLRALLVIPSADASMRADAILLAEPLLRK